MGHQCVNVFYNDMVRPKSLIRCKSFRGNCKMNGLRTVWPKNIKAFAEKMSITPRFRLIKITFCSEICKTGTGFSNLIRFSKKSIIPKCTGIHSVRFSSTQLFEGHGMGKCGYSSPGFRHYWVLTTDSISNFVTHVFQPFETRLSLLVLRVL